MPRTSFTFPTLSGGLLNGLSDDFAPDHGLKVCDNVDFGKAPLGGITLRSAVYDRNLAPPNVETALWLIRFRGYDTDNFPYLFMSEEEVGGYISLYGRFINKELDEMSDPIEINFSQGSWARNFVVPDEDKVYFMGSSQYTPEQGRPTTMIRDSGDLNIRYMGFPPKYILYRSISDTGGEMDTGRYYYQLILTDSNGHRSVPYKLDEYGGEFMSVYIDPGSYIGSDNSVTLGRDDQNNNELPSSDRGGKYKYIYRTKAGVVIDGSDPDNYPVFYLVGVIDNEELSFVDTVSDTDLVTRETLDMSADLPPDDLANAVIGNARMWGFANETSILRYTPQFDYENWPEINSIPIGDADYLSALAFVGDKLLIFKRTKTYGFWGSSIGNFDYRELSSIYGVTNPHTIRVIDENRCIFLDSQNRVILYNNGQFSDISRTIRLPKSDSYWATVFNDYYILWLYEKNNIVGYAYYLPSGVWAKWTDIDMVIPEEPNRFGLKNMVFWDGASISVLGDLPDGATTGLANYEDLIVRTQNTDCGDPTQEKSFKEIEIYFEPLDPTLEFNDKIGTLYFIADEGSDIESSWNENINYDSSDESTRRQKFRIPNGINGKRGSIRFVSNNNMKDFSILQARLWWEPRGTALR